MHPSIYELRKNVHKFVTGTVVPFSKGSVLEVGPDYPGGSPFPELYVDIKTALESKGLEYSSVDTNANIGTTYVGDILDIERLVGDKKFDTVIMLEVIEHVWEFWKLPYILHRIMNTGGTLYLSTPFYFLLHDPKPDYWRMSAQALERQFSPAFDVQITPYPGPGEFPLHYTMVATRK